MVGAAVVVVSDLVLRYVSRASRSLPAPRSLSHAMGYIAELLQVEDRAEGVEVEEGGQVEEVGEAAVVVAVQVEVEKAEDLVEVVVSCSCLLRTSSEICFPLACFLIFCYSHALSLAKKLIADLLKVVVAVVGDRAAEVVVVVSYISSFVTCLELYFSFESSEPQFLVRTLY